MAEMAESLGAHRRDVTYIMMEDGRCYVPQKGLNEHGCHGFISCSSTVDKAKS